MLGCGVAGWCCGLGVAGARRCILHMLQSFLPFAVTYYCASHTPLLIPLIYPPAQTHPPTHAEQGYIKLARNLKSEGQCGIAMQASFPIKKGPNPPEPPPVPPGPEPPVPPPEPQPVACDDTTQVGACGV